MKIQTKWIFDRREKIMNFDYRSLKRAAQEGARIGNWNGKAVFAASAAKLEDLGSGAYYILYDDENKIVGKNRNNWKLYGYQELYRGI